MRRIIILLVLFVTTCTQKKFSPEENLSLKSHLPSISNEIFIFNTKLGFLSEPGPEKVSQLFQAITKKCPIISALQKEFMGYPQYIYSEGGITCIWNQSKEIISFEKDDSNKAILYRSYWYLGYPTLIEKKVSENQSLWIINDEQFINYRCDCLILPINNKLFSDNAINIDDYLKVTDNTRKELIINSVDFIDTKKFNLKKFIFSFFNFNNEDF
jgi:hypothetical protein